MSLKENSYRFGDFVFEADEMVLSQDGKPLSLPPKAVKLLSVLLENRGRIVEKEDLLHEVWQDAFVEEGNITYTVRLLRKTFNDERHAPRFIETVPKRGYRFIAPVQIVEEAVAEPSTPVVARRRFRRLTVVGSAVVFIAIVFGARSYLNRNRNPAEDLYNQIIAMPGYKTMPIPGADGTTPIGEMVASPDGSQAVLRMTRVPALQSDRTFQLWLIDDSGAHSGGLFPFTQSDSTYYVIVPLAKNVLDYQAFGVSVEPTGGSPTPSTTPIVVISTT